MKFLHSSLQAVIVSYQGKQRGFGTYKTKDEAALANKVARNFIAATKNSVLGKEECMQNVKLAKEAASKAVSEMYSSRGSSDDDELKHEPGTLAPGRWQSNEVRRLFCASIAFALCDYLFTFGYTNQQRYSSSGSQIGRVSGNRNVRTSTQRKMIVVPLWWLVVGKRTR